MMIRRTRKAIIIGAGIAGPATAMFLRSAGFESQIFEAWPRATGIGGGLQIAPNGMHVLDELGLADEMVRHRLGLRIDAVHQSERPPARQHQPGHA